MALYVWLQAAQYFFQVYCSQSPEGQGDFASVTIKDERVEFRYLSTRSLLWVWAPAIADKCEWIYGIVPFTIYYKKLSIFPTFIVNQGFQFWLGSRFISGKAFFRRNFGLRRSKLNICVWRTTVPMAEGVRCNGSSKVEPSLGENLETAGIKTNSFKWRLSIGSTLDQGQSSSAARTRSVRASFTRSSSPGSFVKESSSSQESPLSLEARLDQLEASTSG